ncbi:hypothetical protein [Streptomyces sp. cmx-4-9]|uniref:hypothetical protein n=1 Tax=Streptomyces sp. cmx-4-9 TaxID=2790941 RepID=UPI00397FB9F5
MSPIAVGGPALYLGTEETYVALLRPDIDPTQPGVVLAAREAGVSPEEFAGPSDVWNVLVDREDGEGDGFELPGLRDAEAEDFAERLLAAVAAGGPFTLEAGSVLALDARPTGEGYAFSVRVTPPEGEEARPIDLEIGSVPTGELTDHLEAFRRSLA